MTVATQKFEGVKMKSDETMTKFEERFSGIVVELINLDKTYTNKELAMKVLRALPREWDIKTTAMRESKDLNKIELHDLFADLKAYEFELNLRKEEEPYTSSSTKALVATEVNPAPATAISFVMMPWPYS